MPLPTGAVIGILADNLRLRKSVLPIPASQATRWAKDLGLPRGGETILYTGLMYQLIPYIEHLVTMEERLGRTRLASFAPLGRRVNRVLNLAAFMGRPNSRARAANDHVLINVAVLLRQTGVNFGYLYEEELYSGALAHDLGADDVLATHARRVYAVFKKHGVREVITVDPHTTTMLRTVYPQIIPDFDLQVRSYLEVLAERAPQVRAPLSARLAMHDSCVYARYERVIQQPRALLGRAGVTLAEPAHTGRLTWCCGGPVESLFPQKALAMAQKRVAELRQVAPEGVTMCPLCLVNLQKAAAGTMHFEDISVYLRRAYGT